jgi:hypothetical protein
MWRIIWAVVIAIALTSSARSAQIFHRTQSGADGGYTWVYIMGKIEIGDDVRFKSELLNLAKAGIRAYGVYVYSPGGLTYAALKIGRYIRTMYLGSWVPIEYEPFHFNTNIEYWTDFLQSRHCLMVDDNGNFAEFKYNRVTHVGNPNCICASACFLVWAAGAGTHQQGLPENQVKGAAVPRLSILVHRPYFDPKEYALWPGETAKARYELVEKTVRQYLNEMEVPERVVKKMFSVASTEVVPLTRDEVESMDRRSLWPPYLDEMAIAKCKGDQVCGAKFGREIYFDRIKELEKME